jgi:hypothetical protein
MIVKTYGRPVDRLIPSPEVPMKKLIKDIILLTAVPLLLGMGSLQGQAPAEKIPVPTKQYNAPLLIRRMCSRNALI